MDKLGLGQTLTMDAEWTQKYQDGRTGGTFKAHFKCFIHMNSREHIHPACPLPSKHPWDVLIQEMALIIRCEVITGKHLHSRDKELGNNLQACPVIRVTWDLLIYRFLRASSENLDSGRPRVHPGYSNFCQVPQEFHTFRQDCFRPSVPWMRLVVKYPSDLQVCF